MHTSETLSTGLHHTLARLCNATAESDRHEAWAQFVEAHSDTVLRTCRSVVRDHDAAMDAYVYVLEALKEDECRRLRAYVPDGSTRFSTWLVVVTRRLVLDHLRQKYGRSRSESDAQRAEHAARRRLEDLIAEEIDAEQIPDTGPGEPDAAIRRKQMFEALSQAIAELEPADRLLLVLRFSDELPVREIARILDLPSVFHVYRRLGSALSLVRRALARRGVEDAQP